MSNLRFRITKIHQRKCNFCFQWCQSHQPITASLLCCDRCFQNFQFNSVKLQTTQGEFYTIKLLKNHQNESITQQKVKNSLQSLLNNNMQQAYLKWSRIQSIFDQNDYTNEDIEAIEEQIGSFHKGQEVQKENLIDVIKNLSSIKDKSRYLSNIKDKDTTYQSVVVNKLTKHQSQSSLITAGKQQIYASAISKPNRLQDYCQNLGATRFVKKYQYYFDSPEIKKYRQADKSQKTRQFGAQLSPRSFINNIKDVSNIKLEVPKLKFARSFISTNSNEKQLKLSEEELKTKIFTFLQRRSQSTTMNRLMATFVREAYLRTNLQYSMIELVSFKITNLDLLCYFNLFELDNISTIKLINVGLTDQQLLMIMQLITNKNVERLVLTGNALTENILTVFLSNSLPQLKQIYLGKNRINKYRMRQNIVELKNRYILYL